MDVYGEPTVGRDRRWWPWVLGGLLAVVVLVALAIAVVVVAQHWRDRDEYEAAHADYLSGNCVGALAKLDGLIGAARWIDTAGVVDDARLERAECAEIVAADALVPDDPGAALTAYGAFVAANPASPLATSVTERATTLLDDRGAVGVASVASCDALDQTVAAGVIGTAAGQALRTECIQVYTDEGSGAEAFTVALEVLRSSSDPTLTARAGAAVLASPLVCGSLDEVRTLTTIDSRPDELAPLLLDCIGSAAASGDAAQVAAWQIEFLSAMPGRPESPVIEAAVLQSAPACAFMDAVVADPALGARPGFIVSFTLWCAGVAEFSGDPVTAADLYQRFLAAAPDDPRVAAANDGLVRALTAAAQVTTG